MINPSIISKLNLLRNIVKYWRNIPRFISTFLDNMRVYLTGKLPKKGPLIVVWDINNRCNAQCSFCNYWKIKNNNFSFNKRELSLEHKLNIVRELGELGVWILSICSGEPLLTKNLEKIIKEAKKFGMLVNISTNGLLLEEKADMLIDSEVDFITVSIDSDAPEVHNKLRGVEGLFKKAEKGIEKIKKIRSDKRPYIELRCLINKSNAFSLGEVVDYWSNKVDEIIFKPIYQNSNTLFKSPSELELGNTKREKFEIYYQKLLDFYREIDNLYHREIPNYFLDRDSLTKKYVCMAGTFTGEIDCEGNLYPCQEIEREIGSKLGNLENTSFLTLWRSRELQEIRKIFKSGKRCSCWMERFMFNIYLEKILSPIEKIIKNL